VEHALSSPRSPLRHELPRGRVILGIVERDFSITRSYRLAFILDIVFVIVNLAVFFFISRTFRNATTADLHGAPSYFAFAAVGIALVTVIDTASAGLARRVRDEQLTGTLEVLLAHPVRIAELAFGLAGFPFLFALIRTTVYLLVVALWADIGLSVTKVAGLLAVLAASGVAFSALGVLLAAITLVVKRGDSIVGMLVFAMGFVSGAFFPISVLPGWIEPIGRVMPTRFAFDGLRSAMFHGSGWAGDAGTLLLFGAFGIPLSLWLFRRALEIGRRRGSLGQY
jgi:ABC-2 type transport system permease protein